MKYVRKTALEARGPVRDLAENPSLLHPATGNLTAEREKIH